MDEVLRWKMEQVRQKIAAGKAVQDAVFVDDFEDGKEVTPLDPGEVFPIGPQVAPPDDGEVVFLRKPVEWLQDMQEPLKKYRLVLRLCGDPIAVFHFQSDQSANDLVRILSAGPWGAGMTVEIEED